MSKQSIDISKTMNIRDFHFWVKGILDATDGIISEQQWKLLVKQALHIVGKTNTHYQRNIPLMIWGFVQGNGEQYPSEEQLNALIDKCRYYIDRMPFERAAEDIIDRINQMEGEKEQPKRDGVLPGVLPSGRYPLDQHYYKGL